jgi:hypothetical protein
MRILAFLLAFSITLSLSAQSLLDDSRTLLRAKSTLLDSTASDTAQLRAYAEMLAILQHYDESYADSLTKGTALTEAPLHYRSNKMLADWLPMQRLESEPEKALLNPLFDSPLKLIEDSLKKAPRERMMSLMKGSRSYSPADYLSVSKSLQEYSVPPVESSMYLKAAAKESNSNLQNGIVDAPELIEGLFEFVVERAQQEIAVSFMDRFLEEQVPPVKMLFPTVFREISTTGFSYSNSYMDRVRTAFYEDLQLLSIRLPSVLLEDKRFESLQANPIIYNLLTAYTIIGMSQNDVPAEDIIALTHRNLFDNYLQNEKRRNFAVADSAANQSEYQALSSTADTVVNLISEIYDSLSNAEMALLNREDTLLNRRKLALSLLSTADSSDIALLNSPRPALKQLYNPDYQLKSLMGKTDDNTYRLNFLPYLLRGELDPSYLLGLRKVSSYDKYFTELRSEREYRAAGLELARKLNGNWYNDSRLSDLLNSWLKDIRLAEQQLLDYQFKIFPEDKADAELQRLKNQQQWLQEAIKDIQKEWQSLHSLTQQETLAFMMLDTLISGKISTSSAALNARIFTGDIESKGAYLNELAKKHAEVEERLMQLNEKLSEKYEVELPTDPLTAYYAKLKANDPHAPTQALIGKLNKKMGQLQQDLNTVDTAYAKTECKLIDNAEPLIFLTESLSQLMYCLRSADQDQMWISPSELDSAVNNPQLRPIFLGLLYQKMKTVRQFNHIAPEGLSQLVQLTVADLPQIMPVPDSLKAQDTLAFQRKSAFIVNTLSRIVELPLLVNTDTVPSSLQSLSARYPNTLKPLPSITEDVTDFVFYLNQKDHRQAIGSLFRIFADVQPLLEEASKKKKDKGNEAINTILSFLSEYGTFVGGLVDARSGKEVESLLNGIADPPGSSRLKRRRPFSVTLNSYVGASLGHEWWSTDMEEESFTNVAPTLPIGVAFSFLTRKKLQPSFDKDGKLENRVKRGSSFTIFASIIDLGSLFNYRFDDSSAFGNTELTFKNMFKPGAQLQYNFPKSPFYVGVGAQYGPHFRELNGEVSSVQSTRAFLNIGIDVPIKTLYVK